MRKSILGLILIWFVSFPLRAEQPIFTISNLDASHGQTVEVDFHVDNFTNIISVQYSVAWDPTVLKFKSIKNYNTNVPGLNSSVFGTSQNLIDSGVFTLAWIESSITPITIPDGSLFYTVEFEVLGDPCDHTTITITDEPTDIVVAEQGEVEVGLVSNIGGVNVPGTGCATGIEFVGEQVIGACGENVCVEFKVNNFVDVGAMQFSLVFDPNVLQFDTVQNYAPLAGFNPGNTNLAAPGELRTVWFNGNIQNETLPDGTVLFEVCFKVIGTGGQSSTITFGSNPSAPQISDTDGNLYEVSIIPAQVTAQCALEGFAFIATGDSCVQPNGIVCLDINVNDFDDILAFQFSMNWDSTKFEFDHLEGFNLPDLTADVFGTPKNSSLKEGQITVSWIDLTLQGQTKPDNSTIFRLCLKAVGPLGSSATVSFTGIPLDIEIANVDSTITDYTLVSHQIEIQATCVETGCSISYVLNHLDPVCNGDSTGVLNLTVMTPGCNCSPTYLWSTGATTQDLTGQPAGDYTVTITVCDQSVIASATLVDHSPMSITATVVNPNPVGVCNGSIDLGVSGGVGPYFYVWSTSPAQTTEDISNLCAGSYTVTITDNVGCVFISNPIIVGADASAVITSVSCKGGANGAIDLTPAFGSPPYSYTWNTTPVSHTEDLTNLKAGTYCVTITESGGSSRDTCFVVTEPATALTVTATLTNDVNANCQGAIDLNVTGGTQPFSYVWSPGGLTSQDRINLCVGTHCVTVTDGKGCVVDTCFGIFSGNGLNVILTVQQHNGFGVNCNGDCNGVITSTVNGATGALTYHWSNGASTANLSNVCAGTYSLTVTDNGGQSATASSVVSQPPAINLTVTVTDPSDMGTSDGAASVVVTGGVPPYTIHWSGPVDGDGAALNNIPGGAYSLEVTDANGCEETKLVIVGNVGECYKGITVFTPNSDGKNDFFLINCIQNEPNHLFIFNRQGALVYETDNYQNTWIGVDNNDEAVPDGGYLWVLELLGPNGTTTLYKGTVVLLRTAD